ncbi:hypothetical protein [Pelagibacterium xiamenense]|uniref:hypothetical protein n=1 Tax=Pelagibacterium xiamenense TaxID=2901140 RepID=UPI001E2C1229|nr:hypothetical protein [Pelagibacterium xiamenense]MCD7059648.1 hypothetical protein [Pelagibacterium xiamenense]
MRIYLYSAALTLLAVPAWAGDWSVVRQGGFSNFQTTYQSGGHTAVTIQMGNNNSAQTSQTGSRNTSAILQIGHGHSQNHTQTGDEDAMSSLQVSTDLPGFSGHTRSTSVTVGGRTISIYVEAN